MWSTTVIVVVIVLLVLQVDAASAVDGNGGSCESDKISSLSEQNDAKHITEELREIRKVLGEVKLIREDLNSVKSASATIQQQCCAVNTSFLEEQIKQLRRDLKDTQNTATSCDAECIPLLIQQNINGSSFFNRSWAEYKAGFNDTAGNYWIGNDRLSQLTLSGRYKLRFELQLHNLSWYWPEYSTFVVSDESHNYTLQVSGYSGLSRGDALAYNNGAMFTTYDRDNDPWTGGPAYNNNCAVYNGGGFWYKGCSLCNVNTVRGCGSDFEWNAGSAGALKLLTSRMWLTC